MGMLRVVMEDGSPFEMMSGMKLDEGYDFPDVVLCEDFGIFWRHHDLEHGIILELFPQFLLCKACVFLIECEAVLKA